MSTFISQTDYSKIFNRLVHLKALSKQGKVQAVLEDLILTIAAIDNSNLPNSLSGLKNAIKLHFGLEGISEELIRNSLDGLINRNALMSYNNRLTITTELKAEIQGKINASKELERQVREEWLNRISQFFEDLDSDSSDALWAILNSYLAKAFHRHGFQTIQLLQTSVELFEDPEKLSILLNQAIAEISTKYPADLIRQAIRNFFKSSTEIRTKYLSQLLDGTFSFFALAVDDVVAEYLQRELQTLEVFLDTNFIFGILNLHENSFVEVSNELVDLINSKSVPFLLSYHSATLQEIEGTIDSIGERLKQTRWTRALSRTALKSNHLLGLEKLYHRLNAETPTDPADFLSRYKYIQDQLSEEGFLLKQPSALTSEQEKVRNELIAEYDHFLNNEFRRQRIKPYSSMKHDMTVLQTVRGLRQSHRSILDSGALFLTCDYSLYTFDSKYKQSNSINTVVMPNMFLQLLRPFVAISGEFDRRFVETFALPEFRTIHSGYAPIVSGILSVLSAYQDVKEETATRMIANETLIDSLQDAAEGPEFIAVIEQAIVNENNRLLEELEAVKTETTDLAQTKETLEKEQTLSQNEIERLKSENEEAIRRKDEELRSVQHADEEKLKLLEAEKQREIEQLTTDYANSIQRIRYIAAGTIAIFGILLLLFISSSPDVLPGLSAHPRSLALRLSGLGVILCVSTLVAHDRFRKEGIIIGVIFAIAVGVLQII